MAHKSHIRRLAAKRESATSQPNSQPQACLPLGSCVPPPQPLDPPVCRLSYSIAAYERGYADGYDLIERADEGPAYIKGWDAGRHAKEELCTRDSR